jgi:hypothetical protein
MADLEGDIGPTTTRCGRPSGRARPAIRTSVLRCSWALGVLLLAALLLPVPVAAASVATTPDGPEATAAEEGEEAVPVADPGSSPAPSAVDEPAPVTPPPPVPPSSSAAAETSSSAVPDEGGSPSLTPGAPPAQVAAEVGAEPADDETRPAAAADEHDSRRSEDSTREPAIGAAAAAVTARQQDNVTICHRTNSPTNPYNQVVVARASVVSAHGDHIGPVFAPGVDDWGDIIPPLRPELPRGLNWRGGQDILRNGCEVPPDVGPLPDASLGELQCVGTDPRLVVTVSNDAEATAPARFAVFVDGVVVDRVGPVPPGGSETVVLDGGDLAGLEDDTFTVAVRSGGKLVTSEVVTLDCAPGPPVVVVDAGLACEDGSARGVVEVTNNGTDPVQVSLEVDGAPVGAPVDVPPGASETGTVDLSAYEDTTVTATVVVDGTTVASFVITPDCVEPRPQPEVSVAGQVCPPPSTTVTLSNTGDPESRVIFVIRVDGRIVQVSAPVYGGDSTTIVGDLSRFEDQTVVVEVRANGEVLGSRTIAVDCEPEPGPEPGPDPGPGTDTGAGPGSGSDPDAGSQSVATGLATGGTPTSAGGVTGETLPQVGATVTPALIMSGLGLVLAGSLLIAVGQRTKGTGTTSESLSGQVETPALRTSRLRAARRSGAPAALPRPDRQPDARPSAAPPRPAR